MFTYKFFVRKDKGNSLKLRLTNNRKSTECSLGINISQENLDDAMSRKPRPENVRWKSLIVNMESKLEDIKCELLKSGRFDEDVKVIRQMVLRECFDNEEGTESKSNFVSHYMKFMESKSNRGTKGVYSHTLDRIRLYDPDIDKRSFDEIDLRWLTDFEAFCAKSASKNARNIHLRNIRAVFNNAIDYELTASYPFRRFKIRPEATRKRSLTLDDLRRLFEYKTEPYAEIYRDMFKLIFFFIGINAVDLHSLKSVENGRINYRRAKTGKLYSIKVEPEAMDIINKYKGEKGLLCISDRWSDYRNFTHQCNKALQRIGETERKGRGGKKIIKSAFPGLSTYWARHTWATIAADLDIPDAVIGQALGHTSAYTTTDIYIRRNERKVDEANRLIIDRVLYGL